MAIHVQQTHAGAAVAEGGGTASTNGGAPPSTKGDGAAVAANTYYLHPEYKLPEDVTDTSTEAVAPGTRLWRWSGDESLYPFWAVERVTDTWIHRTNAEFTFRKESTQFEFNVEHKELEFACVSVGAVQGKSIAVTVTVRLPVLTNTRDLKKGTRLFMKAVAKPADKRKPESWKTHVGKAAKAQKLQEVAKGKAKAKATPKGLASAMRLDI